MKILSGLIFSLCIITLSFINIAIAQSNTPELKEKGIKAKCYVELVGGGETISLWLVKPSLLKELAHNIVGQEILLIGNITEEGKNKKSTIYIAKECILEEDQFSSPRARALDKDMPR